MAGISSLRIRLHTKSTHVQSAIGYGLLHEKSLEALSRPDFTTLSLHLCYMAPWIQYSSVVVTSPTTELSIIINHYEGNAPGYSSRTKLAQVYPYRFCSILIKSILPLGNSRAFYPSQLSLTVDLLDCLDIDELRGVQKQLADFTAVEHPVFASDVFA